MVSGEDGVESDGPLLKEMMGRLRDEVLSALTLGMEAAAKGNAAEARTLLAKGRDALDRLESVCRERLQPLALRKTRQLFERLVGDVRKRFDSLDAALAASDADFSSTVCEDGNGQATEFRLEPAGVEDFQGLDLIQAWSDDLLAAGFESCGDFVIRGASIAMRAFFEPPSVFALACWHQSGLGWCELTAFNADGTSELWTNTAFLGDPVAPWMTRAARPSANVRELHEALRAGRSGKPMAQLSGDCFPELFASELKRTTQWRADVAAAKKKPPRSTRRPAKRNTNKAASHATAGRTSASAMRLPKGVESEIARMMQDGEADLPLEEIADRRTREYLQDWLSNAASLHPGWTLERHTALALAGWLNWRLLDRGIARRLALDDPAELAACVSLESRFRWMSCGRPRGSSNYTNVWPVLRAVGAGDFGVARRFAETGLFPLIGESGCFVPFYNAVFAVLRNEMDYPRTLMPTKKRLPNKAPIWLAAMYDCLAGIVQDSPDLVADGLDRVFATCGRRQHVSALEKTIFLEGHGLYELSRSVSPDLVAGFDTGRSWPWDEAYHQWVRSHGDPAKDLHLEKISPILHDWVTNLAGPEAESYPAGVRS